MDEQDACKVKPDAATLIWQFVAICLGKLYIRKTGEEVMEFWKLFVVVEVAYRRYGVCSISYNDREEKIYVFHYNTCSKLFHITGSRGRG